MTNFARSLARAAGLHSPRLRSVLAFSIAAGACLFAAAPAQALVKEVAGTTVGLQPRTTALVEPSNKFANNEGNAVVSGASVYAVYWDPGAWFHHEWLSNVDQFFQDFGAGSGEFGTIFSALGQYRDRANEQASYRYVFKGAYTDTAPYPAEKCTDPEALAVGQVACVTDAQIRAQLQSFIATHGTPKGMHSIYYVLTPPGVSVCLDEASKHCSDYKLGTTEIEKGERASETYKNSFCSYHGAINPNNAPQGDTSTVLYGAIPWTAGYEGNPWNFIPGASNAGFAIDCQDGGWNPEKGIERHESIKKLTKEEEEKLAELEGEEKLDAEEAHRLTGPHIQEPNQEPDEKGEEGDDAPGLSDLLVNQIAVEQANIVTDPLLTSWQDHETGFEATDECRNVFAATAAPSAILGEVVAKLGTKAGTISNETILESGDYYINNVVNQGELHRARCAGGIGLVPRFTSPDPVNAGEVVDFNGMESTVSEFKGAVFGASGPPNTTYATFKWNFGDGSAEVTGFAPGAPVCEAPWLSPCAASVFHSYTYGGTYEVSLTVSDVAGHAFSVTHNVTVAGPPPPAPAAAPATGATPGAGAPGTGTGTGTGNAGRPQPGKPVATASVVSHSLKTAVKKGVVVAYSVNEQVTGRFEVLISKSLAKKLHISGTTATGLPAGTPPQLVIGKAILVTTKGGHSVEHVMLSKSASRRLRHAHRAPLMLRLIVRNAGTAPQSTTVISAATLVG